MSSPLFGTNSLRIPHQVRVFQVSASVGTGSVRYSGALLELGLIEEKAGGQRPLLQQNQTEPRPAIGERHGFSK